MDTFWGHSATFWTGIYTLITAGLLVVAVIAAVYAWRQWRASREQIDNARKAAVEANRPYILVTAEPSDASWRLFDLSVRNIGHRPARSIGKSRPASEEFTRGGGIRDCRYQDAERSDRHDRTRAGDAPLLG